MSLAEVTIVVPTYNRPRELRRLLTFFGQFEPVHQILVLDGSRDENKAINRIVIERAAGTNAVHLPYDPELHAELRVADGMRQVRTEFCITCADDDFIFPPVLAQCVAFMKQNPDYAAAIGWMKTMSYGRTGWRKRGFSLGAHLEHGRDINHDQYCHRFAEYMAYTFLGFVPLYYSVRRTSSLRAAKALGRGTMKYVSVELLNVMLALLEGKLRVLPAVMGIRDYSSETIRNPERDDPVTYFTAPDLAYVREVMMDKLVREHGFDETIAKYTLDLQLIRAEHRCERVPETPFRRKVGAFLNDLQYIGSIVSPDRTADYLGIDRATYRALRHAQAGLDEPLPQAG